MSNIYKIKSAYSILKNVGWSVTNTYKMRSAVVNEEMDVSPCLITFDSGSQ